MRLKCKTDDMASDAVSMDGGIAVKQYAGCEQVPGAYGSLCLNPGPHVFRCGKVMKPLHS